MNYFLKTPKLSCFQMEYSVNEVEFVPIILVSKFWKEYLHCIYHILIIVKGN